MPLRGFLDELRGSLLHALFSQAHDNLFTYRLYVLRLHNRSDCDVLPQHRSHDHDHVRDGTQPHDVFLNGGLCNHALHGGNDRVCGHCSRDGRSRSHVDCTRPSDVYQCDVPVSHNGVKRGEPDEVYILRAQSQSQCQNQ